jgi:WD40 repeat protein
MKQVLAGLCMLALAVACKSESGSCGLLPEHSTGMTRAHRPRPPKVAVLEAQYGQPLRVAHAHAIGDVLGVRWSDDERLLAVWSESTVLVFDVRTGHWLARISAAPDRGIDDAALSSNGRWVVASSHLPDAEDSTLELFAVGEPLPKKRWTRVARATGASWQMGRDSRTIAWLEVMSRGPKPAVRLRTDTVDRDEPNLVLDLQATDAQEVYGLDLGKSGKVVVVRLGDRMFFVDVAAARSDHYPALSDPALTASGEAAAWASGEGWLVRSLHEKRPVSLVDARCAPRHWPALAASKALFSEDERTLATSGARGVCLWDIGTGRLRTVLSSRDQQSDGDMPRSPDAWVLAGKGLIIRGTELWDVEHRRLVKSGFSAWSDQPEPLLVDVPEQVDQPARLSSVDAEFAVHEIAHEDCSLDLYSGKPNLLGLAHAAVIACQPNPWIVDLQTKESRRIARPSGTAIGRSPHGRLLTLQTEKRRDLIVADPSRPGSEHALISELGAGSLARYDSERLELLDWEDGQQFEWTAVEFKDPAKVRLDRGRTARRCANGDSYPIGAHFAWSRSDSGSLVLCDLTTGTEIGALENPGRVKLMAVNADASLAVAGDPRGRFWFPRERRTVDLNATVFQPIFAGPHTVVGVSDGKVVTADPSKGVAAAGWELSSSDGSVLAADLASDLIVLTGTKPTLRRLGTGRVIAELPVPRLQTAAFGPNSQLAATDGQRIWLWHLPSPEPLGELLLGKSGVLFIASDGTFETSDPIAHWEASLSCGVGPETLPVSTCLESLYERGLVGQALRGGGKAGLRR